MRSKLFVPGVRPDLFEKALAGEADAISFDLEDSVPAALKLRARHDLADFLRLQAARQSSSGGAPGKLLIVRVNALASEYFAADLEACARAGVAYINLPKVEGAADVRAAAAALELAERRNAVTEPLRLLANIESAVGVNEAAAIAGAHPRVAGLQLGLADLFESLHIDRRDERSVHAAMFAVRLAAGEHGRFAYDGAFPDIEDADGFRREAEQAKRLGFLGKSCVHPKQVGLANEIFGVAALSLASARRIVAAAALAAEQGRGAFLLDGRMIDAPMIKRAQAALADAHAAGGA